MRKTLSSYPKNADLACGKRCAYTSETVPLPTTPERHARDRSNGPSREVDEGSEKAPEQYIQLPLLGLA